MKSINQNFHHHVTMGIISHAHLCIYWWIIHSASLQNVSNKPMKFHDDDQNNTQCVRMHDIYSWIDGTLVHQHVCNTFTCNRRHFDGVGKSSVRERVQRTACIHCTMLDLMCVSARDIGSVEACVMTPVHFTHWLHGKYQFTPKFVQNL